MNKQLITIVSLSMGKVNLFLILFLVFDSSCSANPNLEKGKDTGVTKNELKKAYFASGCFWCVEAIFESVNGVKEAISGYAGGDKQRPTYREVSSGLTSHTETVEVIYDPKVIDYKTLLKVFYGSHDPTTVNGQHPDYGTQYRSAIFYTNAEEKKLADDYKQKMANSGEYQKPIVTEISKLKTFWKAEDYHQNFERLNPNQPYVRAVSVPRLKRFQAKFPEILKK